MKRPNRKSPDSQGSAAASYSFLIVDDSTFSRMNLRGLLEENGHKVVGEAHDADEALNLYKETNPEFVTMDLNMPQKTGLDAIREIQAIDPKARFIIITAVDEKLVWGDNGAMANCEYVGKPVEWKKLRSVINRIVAKSAPRTEG